MPIAHLPDVELYYEECGSGEPLLLVMGLGCPSGLWLYQTKELSKHFRVITFDNRGIGRSGPGTGEYSIEAFADDAAGLIRSLGLERAHVAGISMGGAIAQQMVIRHPDVVDRVVFGCTWCRTTTFGRVLLGMWRDVAIRAGLETLTRVTLTQYLTPAFIDGNEDTVNRLAALFSDGVSLETYIKQNLACERHDACGKLSNWDGEALVIVGGRDGQTTPRAGKELASELARSELVVLEGVGHGMMWEAPDRFNAAIVSFLERR